MEVVDVTVHLTDAAWLYQQQRCKDLSVERYKLALKNGSTRAGARAVRDKSFAASRTAVKRGRLVDHLLAGHAPLSFRLAAAADVKSSADSSADTSGKPSAACAGEHAASDGLLAGGQEPKSAEVWVTEEELLERQGGRAALARFVQKWQAEERLPEAGNVGVLSGGPPCQDVGVACTAWMT